MSVRLYVYRIDPSRLWEIHAKVRAWAMRHSPGAQKMLRALALDEIMTEQDPDYDRSEGHAYRLWQACDKAPETSRQNEDISVQIFEEDAGTLLLRFLSTWHPTRFVAAVEEQAGRLGMQEVFAQNSSDMSEEDKRNMPIADAVDDLISAKRYAVSPIYTADDTWRLMFARKDDDDDLRDLLDETVQKVRDEQGQEPSELHARIICSMLGRALRGDVSAYGELVADPSLEFEEAAREAATQLELQTMQGLNDARSHLSRISAMLAVEKTKAAALQAIDTLEQLRESES